jgi:hypothetical protein
MLLLIGLALIVLSFLAMNVRPFGHGDMRVFTWIGANAILTVIGVLFLLAAAAARIARPRKSDQNES